METDEKRARYLCSLRGQDPDQLISHGAEPNEDGTVYAVLLKSPRWRLALKEIENFRILWEAVTLND